MEGLWPSNGMGPTSCYLKNSFKQNNIDSSGKFKQTEHLILFSSLLLQL